MKSSLLIFLLSFSVLGFTNQCKIVTYPHIIKINNVLDQEVLKSSTCDDKINKKVINLLSTADGKLRSQHLSQTIISDKNVVIEPAIINLSTLKVAINKQLGSSDKEFSKITSLHSKSFFSSDKTPIINFSCQGCDTPGQKNIKMNFNKRAFWISGQLLRKTIAYKAKQSVSYLTPILESKDFKRSEINTKIRAPLFTDIKNIKFYKPTRNISAGEILKLTDLTPKNIITRGQKIKVIIKNKNISLTSVAKAMKNGKIGDFINIINPKSKKTSLAKVIDYNKVLIEL